MTLTFLGGVIGVLAAIGISKLIGFLIPTLPASNFQPGPLIAGLTVSVAIGLILWRLARAQSRATGSDRVSALRN